MVRKKRINFGGETGKLNLTIVSKKLFGKSFAFTTDAESRKVKDFIRRKKR